MSEPSRKRRRPPKACEQCRRRKVRCDQNQPCNQCIRLKIDNCSYDPLTVLKRTSTGVVGGPASRAPPTPASTVGRDVDSNGRGIRSSTTTAVHTPVATTDAVTTNQTHHGPAELLEDRLLHLARSDNEQNSSALPFRAALHGIVTKTRLLGRSHWLNVVQEFQWVVDLQQRLEAGVYGDTKIRLDLCKKLGREVKSQLISELKTFTDPKDHVPSRQVADSLVENYFRTYESCYRILHIPSFHREYEEFWEAPNSANRTFVIKLLLVLAIGTCLSDESSIHDMHALALQWINAAQSWLSSPFTEKARVSVSGIQAHCLLLLAREICAVSPDLIWISAGSLLRTAMLSGLHRDPSQFPRLTAAQSEVRRRLWATVTEICLQTSMNAGGEPMISVEMYDCQLPVNLDDEDIDGATGAIGVPKEADVFTRASLQIALMQSMPLRAKIAKTMNDFRAEQTFSETLQIGSKLSKLLNQHSPQPAAGHTTNMHSWAEIGLQLYQLMTSRFMLSLHQVFTIKAMTDPLYYFSRKVCLDTSLSICTSVFPAPTGRIANPDLKRILEVICGVPKNTIMLAFLLLSLELVTQLSDAGSNTSSVPDKMLRQEIFRLIEADRDHMLCRIRLGETNVKGYIFSAYSLMKLREEAAGRPGDQATLIEGARAIETAIEILQQRLHNRKTLQPSYSPGNNNASLGEDFSVAFGDDFGWDDWDPSFNFGSSDFFLAQS